MNEELICLNLCKCMDDFHLMILNPNMKLIYKIYENDGKLKIKSLAKSFNITRSKVPQMSTS